jgi:hypothetical protein
MALTVAPTCGLWPSGMVLYGPKLNSELSGILADDPVTAPAILLSARTAPLFDP